MNKLQLLYKRLKSKTYWLGIAVFLYGYLNTYQDQILSFIPEHYKNLAVLIIGLLIFICREVTTKPLSGK